AEAREAEAAAATRGAARAAAAGAGPPRARAHGVRLRLPARAHRRGCEREDRLHPWGVPRRAPRARQVGLPQVRDPPAGTGTATGHRQGDPDRGTSGAGEIGRASWRESVWI